MRNILPPRRDTLMTAVDTPRISRHHCRRQMVKREEEEKEEEEEEEGCSVQQQGSVTLIKYRHTV
jgi:hypothetical protein